jgi:hypothetical protein
MLSSSYFGTEFNVVIDADQNGTFDHNDKVDTHDIENMRQYFVNNTTLGPDSTQTQATSEYKEFLNKTLTLNPPLDSSTVYDLQTQQASNQFVCNTNLTSSLFENIKAAAQIGFRVLPSNQYKAGQINSGSYVYNDAVLNSVSFNGNSKLKNTCIVAKELDLDKVNLSNGVQISAISQNSIISGALQLNNSSLCMFGSTLTLLSGTSITVAAASVGAPPIGIAALTVITVGGLVGNSLNKICQSKE